MSKLRDQHFSEVDIFSGQNSYKEIILSGKILDIFKLYTSKILEDNIFNGL